MLGYGSKERWLIYRFELDLSYNPVTIFREFATYSCHSYLQVFSKNETGKFLSYSNQRGRGAGQGYFLIWHTNRKT